MYEYYCKKCGTLLKQDKHSAICLNCHSQTIVPTFVEQSLADDFNRANELRQGGNFSRAQEIYDKLAKKDDDLEILWGQLLCKYGVVYDFDPTNNKYFPACRKTFACSILDDSLFQKLVSMCSNQTKDIYLLQAKEIHECQKDYLQLVEDSTPYDLFIAYGKKSKKIVDDLLNDLGDKNYRICLNDLDKIERSKNFLLIISTDSDFYKLADYYLPYLEMMNKNHHLRFFIGLNNYNENDIPNDLMVQSYFNFQEDDYLTYIINNVERKKIKKDYSALYKTKGFHIFFYFCCFVAAFCVLFYILYQQPIDQQLQTAHNGDYVNFGRYEIDNNRLDGREHLRWLVLENDDDHVLLVCENVIAYSEISQADLVNSFSQTSIKEWLNNDFYNEAFNDKEKTFLKNSNLQILDDEIVENYFFDASQRVPEISKYVVNLYHKNGDYAYWVYNNERLALVDMSGEIIEVFEPTSGGIRPVILINY